MEPILKIFGSKYHHDSPTIIGNRSALEGLRDSINKALDVGSNSSMFTETDGEFYDLDIKLHDYDIDSDKWDNLPMHYHSDDVSTKERDKWQNLFNLLDGDINKIG